MELAVLRFVNHTHTTATEFFKNAVVRNGLVNYGWEHYPAA